MRAFIVLSICLSLTSQAWAGGFYNELGGGMAWIRQGEPVWGSGLGSLPRPYVANWATMINVSNLLTAFQWHFGIQYRGHILMKPTLKHSHSIYPAIRVEFRRMFFLGGGVTPIVYSNSSGSIQRPAGIISAIAEFGYEWMVTPFFFFVVSVAGQAATSNAGYGPLPTAEAALSLRWYWGPRWSNTAQGNRWDGWRYPLRY